MQDVIVVGARCAGSAIALQMARLGYKVLMIERDRMPSDMAMSTHFLHSRAVACLARWGLLDSLVASGTPPVRRIEVDLGPFVLSGEPPTVDGEDRSFAPRRRILDEIILQGAIASGAELRDECAVSDILEEHGRVVGVKATTRDGRVFSEAARIVIGADGPASLVAARTGARENQTTPPLQGTAWFYWQDLPLEHLAFHPRAFEAIYAFPTSGESTLVGANWSIDRFRAARGDIENEYFGVLRRCAPAIFDSVSSARRDDTSIRVGSTRSFQRKSHGPGWALLGDARFKKDPCTAQGITDAFCDAESLSMALDAGFRGKSELTTALDQWEQESNAWNTPFMDFACQLASFAPPSDEALALYSALRGNQADISMFIGMITETVSPQAFFAPDNVRRILQTAA